MSATLPPADEAVDTLQKQVYNRVFFAKLASAGYAPTTNQEAAKLLEMGTKLRTLKQASEVKQASANGILDEMDAALDATLANYGIAPLNKQAEANYDAAARTLMADPTLYNCVLSVKSAHAQDIRQQLQPAAKA